MKNMKTRSLIISALTILFLLLIPIVLSNIVEILLEFGTGINIELGSGVNITEGTIIRLDGLNCNLTVLYDHTMNYLEVNHNYFLINTSVAPTWIEGLPYTYSSETKQINITCYLNTEKTFYVNISNFGGIKVYSVSEPANIISVSWNDVTKQFKLKVNSSLSTSTTKVYWNYSSEPSYSCDYVPCSDHSWDSVNKIVTLTSHHSSPVEWTLGVQQAGEPPKWSNFFRNPPEPTIITTLDPVTINVTWSDDYNLNTVMIWENSTRNWQGHVVYVKG
jgi:hypothetical protein